MGNFVLIEFIRSLVAPCTGAWIKIKRGNEIMKKFLLFILCVLVLVFVALSVGFYIPYAPPGGGEGVSLSEFVLSKIPFGLHDNFVKLALICIAFMCVFILGYILGRHYKRRVLKSKGIVRGRRDFGRRINLMERSDSVVPVAELITSPRTPTSKFIRVPPPHRK